MKHFLGNTTGLRLNKSGRVLGTALLIALALLFSGCPNPVESGPSPNPGETGTFSLTIDTAGAGKTIMPAPVSQAVFDNYYYKLVFTAVTPGGLEPVIANRTKTDISNPVALPLGTWDLVVTAYKDAAREQPVMEGRLNEIVIAADNPVSESVTLKAISGAGEGTFRWNITLAEGMDTATMKILNGDGTPARADINLLGTVSPDTRDDSLQLPSGYYSLVFTISKPGTQEVQWKEILHVYQNMESPFSFDFTDEYLNGNIHTVTYVYNNGASNGEETKLHGEAITKPAEPEKTGYIFDGWYKDNNTFQQPWIFEGETNADKVTGSISLYAKWNEDYFTTLKTWLLSQPENTEETPYDVTLESGFAFGTMTAETSNWKLLLDAIETGERYVKLDLSACEMDGTEFNPDNTVATGKGRIVEITLPDTAVSISNGSLSNAAFRNFTVLRSFCGVGLKTIGEYAFMDCESLVMTKLPGTITNIGRGAFWSCTELALTELPSNLTVLESFVFSDCTKLALTALPSGIVSIGGYAFDSCTNLKALTLPASAEIRFQNPFLGCTSLTSFTLTGSGPLTTANGGKALVMNGNKLVSYPGAIGAVTVDSGITVIEIYAFSESAVSSINLPSGLISIESNAFEGCTSLTNIDLPTTLNSIGVGAFQDCTSLTNIDLPASLTSINGFVFDGCTSLADIELPDELNSIGLSAFQDCTNLTSIELPDALDSIDEQAFYGCIRLTSIELPASLNSIGSSAFTNCTSLSLVTVKNAEPPALESSAFTLVSPSLKIKVPAASVNDYKNAEGWRFYADYIDIITVGAVNEVAAYLAAQAGGADVDNPVYLPMEIDLGTMTDNPGTWRRLINAIENAGKYVNLDLSVCTMTGTEFNPDPTVATGKLKIVEIALPDTAESIADDNSPNKDHAAFKNFGVLKSFSGTRLTTIGSFAFRDQTSFTVIELPATITAIKDYAFASCDNLEQVSLPEGLLTIGGNAFDSCVKLNLTSLPTTVTSIGTLALSNLDIITEFTVPASVISIGNMAFYSSNALEFVTCLGTTPPTLGVNAFSGTADTLQIKVPLTSLDDYLNVTDWSKYAAYITAIE